MTVWGRCCCGDGCGQDCTNLPGTRECRGTPVSMPNTISLSFVPHWLMGWGWGKIDGCGYSGPTDPGTSCDGSLGLLGTGPEWKSESTKTVSLTKQEASSTGCTVKYSGTVATSIPNDLDSFSDNPWSVTGPWDVLETGRDVWGSGGTFYQYAIDLTYIFNRFAVAGSRSNRLSARLTVGLNDLVSGDTQTFCYQSPSTGEDADDCGCGPTFWSGIAPTSLSVDCLNHTGFCTQSHMRKWDQFPEAGTSTASFSASRSDACCEDLSADYTYFQYNDVGSGTTACPEYQGRTVCGLVQPDYMRLCMAQGPSGGDYAYHWAEDYKSSSQTGPCMIGHLVYGIVCGVPALTDITLS